MRTNGTDAAPAANRRAGCHPAPHLELLAVGILGRTSLGDRIELLLGRGREFSTRVSPVRVGASAVVLLMLVATGSFAPRWIAFAQEADRPSFEVASVKPGDPNERGVSLLIQPGGRLTTRNASLQVMIGFAYDVRNHQISGGPNWMDSAKFNIEAKAGGDFPMILSPEVGARFRLMLQSLLAERFKLVVRKETREEPIYELALDKGGSKLKEVEAKQGTPQGLRAGGRGQLTGMAAPISLLINQLSQQTGRSIVDRTGLAGKYDFTLQWTPDPGGPPIPGGPDSAPSPDPSGPSLFTALQEQLGLKLQSAKGPVEVLVIDHVEKPSEN